MLRHELRRKVAPIAVSLHPCCVQPRPSSRTLKSRASCANLSNPARACTLQTAVPLPPIAPRANPNLPPAPRLRTTEDSIPLVDHRRPARQFLDKRRESIDTVITVARPRGAPESSDLESGLSPYLAGAALYPPSWRRAEFWRPSLALGRAKPQIHALLGSHRQKVLVANNQRHFSKARGVSNSIPGQTRETRQRCLTGKRCTDQTVAPSAFAVNNARLPGRTEMRSGSGMFDWFVPHPPLTCPKFGTLLPGWRGKSCVLLQC